MNERLLHFIWEYRLFDQQKLTTVDGERIEVLNPGMHNSDSGADFQHAKVRIGKTLWAGNVELHIESKDWFAHKHQKDGAYNNVILHVVFNYDGKAASTKEGSPIPTLELRPRISAGTLQRYEDLAKRKEWIPCAKFFKNASELTVKTFSERLLIERLESKVAQVNEMLAESEQDWEHVMFCMLGKYFGASVNKDPFLMLARSLPHKIWAKYQDDRLQLEALVFGQAGLLDEKFDDEYPNTLRKEYTYLKRLHQLQPLKKELWKFLRLRPSNFPTVRLAQLAGLMHKDAKLFSQIIDAENAKQIHRLLDADVSDYWRKHYRFDKPSKSVNSKLGADMKNTLLINAIAPVLFAYGKYKDDERYCDKAIRLLEACAAESNTIINGWKKLNLKPTSAYETQSLLQLKNGYCDKFRCLECAIGHHILK